MMIINLKYDLNHFLQEVQNSYLLAYRQKN